MRENGLKGRVVTVTRRAPRLRRFQQDGENLRLGAPTPTECNEQWVADLTYIKVGEQYQHLITIMDVYSRRILGWSLCDNPTVDDVLPLLRRVIKKRRPSPGLIFHTDRGIECMAYAIQAELEKTRPEAQLQSSRLLHRQRAYGIVLSQPQRGVNPGQAVRQ
jgi:transposase InsO family protein